MKIHFKNNRDERIVGVLTTPNKKSSEINIIIHGFTSNKEYGSKITAELLAKNNINSLTIDLNDCGESESKFEEMTITRYVDTILCAIHYCEKKGFRIINLIGTSSGGLLVMVAALKYPNLNSLILRSTSAFDAEWFKEFAGGNKGLAEWKKKGYIQYKNKNAIKKLKYDYYKDALKYNMYKKSKNIKIPTLIIHGTKDPVIPIKNTIKLAKNFPKAKLVKIEGADHTLGVNGDYTESQNIILEWIRKAGK